MHRRSLSHLASPFCTKFGGPLFPTSRIVPGRVGGSGWPVPPSPRSMGKLSSALLGGVKRAFQPRFLLLTNTTVCCGLLGFGDSLQQLFANHSLDRERSSRVMTTALALGPMNHYWYRWLDKALVGKDFRVVMAKVLLDLLSCPAFSSTYVVGVALQEGRSVVEALEEYKAKCLSIFTLDLSVWPLTQTINFYFLPPSVRVLYTSGVQVLYNAGISSIKHNGGSQPTSREEAEREGPRTEASAKAPAKPLSTPPKDAS